MHIKQLQLKNYRNYDTLNLSFDHKINVIIGENAQGKTNLMEAIYVLAFTKSHRTAKDRELIQWDHDFAKINGLIEEENNSFPLEIVISNKGKKAKLNHLEQKRLSDYIGSFNVVMFAPEDLSLVKGSPQLRRRFIDMELGQIQPRYIFHLMNYQKVLRQRNHLLRKIKINQKEEKLIMLDVLTEQLIMHGAQLLKRRFEFLSLLRKWAAPIHYGISRELENLEIVYEASIDVSEEDDQSIIESKFLDQFTSIRQREIERATTLIGPHRDDLKFFVNGRNVQTFGSQGQQRTTALSLKLAELELIYNKVGKYPILLLDDVLSELDDFRQSHLLNTIHGKVQTFVSTTSIDGLNHEALEKAEIFHVHNGKIIE